MVHKNRTIQLRLTKQQHEIIKNTSKMKGFNTISAYARYKMLDEDFTTQQKIIEMHNHLLGPDNKKKYRKNSALEKQTYNLQ